VEIGAQVLGHTFEKRAGFLLWVSVLVEGRPEERARGHLDDGDPRRQLVAAAKKLGDRAYACEGDFAERLDVGADLDGAAILGGFDCVGWRCT
jgi:hypothetical protein